MSGTLSLSASARKRRAPGTVVILLKSFIMCEAVEALPPFPMMNVVASACQPANKRSTNRSTASREIAATTPSIASK
jgi:hypothetical protein